MPAYTAASTGRIAFQGALGAFSDMSCRAVFPKMETIPCETFDEAFKAVESGAANLAMIPVDNTLAGRVADVHRLLPAKDLYIIGEHFQPISMCLLGLKGAKPEDLTDVYSHVHALPQCKQVLTKLGVKTHIHADTAGSAKDISEQADKTKGAIASKLAADIYGLDVLMEDIQDTKGNTTRFLILSPDMIKPKNDSTPVITSFLFEVRNIPAALYKAMGGFATNGIQMIKLESYIDPQFTSASFYAEVLGHPDERSLGIALEELAFFAKSLKVMGTYPAHPFRQLTAD